ncbi:MAG: alpha/beta hydrolase [Pseudomonadota bacterium]
MATQIVRTSDNAEISVDIAGEGPPIVFLHGWAMTSSYWSAQLHHFQSGFQVIAPNFRGHGASSDVAYGHRIARYAKDILEIIEALAPGQPFAMVGWSMGASVALAFCDLFPDRAPSHLVLVDQTPCLLNGHDWSGGMPGLTRETMNETVDAVRNDFAGFLDGFLPNMFVSPPDLEELKRWRNESLALSSASAATILADHISQDWRDVIAGVSVPTLAIAGGDFLPIVGMKHIPAINPNIRLEVMTGQRHCPFLESAPEFNSLLSLFFSE